MLDFVFDFGPFWVPFWCHFGTPNRPFWGSIFALFSNVAPRGPQEPPRGPQELPKSTQRGPQDAPRGPQDRPRRPKRPPRTAKSPPRPPKMSQNRPKNRPKNRSENRSEIEADPGGPKSLRSYVSRCPRAVGTGSEHYRDLDPATLENYQTRYGCRRRDPLRRGA